MLTLDPRLIGWNGGQGGVAETPVCVTYSVCAYAHMHVCVCENTVEFVQGK